MAENVIQIKSGYKISKCYATQKQLRHIFLKKLQKCYQLLTLSLLPSKTIIPTSNQFDPSFFPSDIIL